MTTPTSMGNHGGTVTSCSPYEYPGFAEICILLRTWSTVAHGMDGPVAVQPGYGWHRHTGRSGPSLHVVTRQRAATSTDSPQRRRFCRVCHSVCRKISTNRRGPTPHLVMLLNHDAVQRCPTTLCVVCGIAIVEAGYFYIPFGCVTSSSSLSVLRHPLVFAPRHAQLCAAIFGFAFAFAVASWVG